MDRLGGPGPALISHYVRCEIELALTSDSVVIPVLVENAALPSAESLPPTIRELTKRHAIELSDKRWTDDVQDLIRQLDRRGIVAAKTGPPERASARPPGYHVVTTVLADFLPGLCSLLYQPRRFLRRRATGRAADLSRAFVFFSLTVLLGVAILLSGYTPAQSMVSFGLTVLMLGVVATVALSAPLWVAWRLAGATRHYSKLLVILLHQAAVLHLATMLIVWILVVALDLRSVNVPREVIDEAMKPGTSISAGLATMRDRLEPLVSASETRLGLGLGALVFVVSVAWTIWSYGAYRETFGLSRTRSAAAIAILMAIGWAVSRLVDLLVRGHVRQ